MARRFEVGGAWAVVSGGAGRARWWLGAVLGVLVPLGLASKFYAGPGAAWVRGSLGGVLYEMFWILLVVAVRPTRRVLAWATAVVLMVTVGLEFAQLWHGPMLEAVRATFIGRSLIGSTFAWSDMVYYAIGSGTGYAVGAWVLGGSESARPASTQSHVNGG
jgi:hypothetical protein